METPKPASVQMMTDGKYVTVKTHHGRPKLCAIDVQGAGNAPSVNVSERNSNQMALCFGNGKESYYLKVDQGQLRLENAAVVSSSDLPDSHWFVRETQTANEEYGLRSLHEPGQYLSTKKSIQRHLSLTLSADPQRCVMFTQTNK